MRFLLGIGLLVCFVSAASAESSEPVWSATEPEGSCNQNGLQILAKTIKVTEDTIISFHLRFTPLPALFFLSSNLSESTTNLTGSHFAGGTRVTSFAAEQIGGNWKLQIKFWFVGLGVKFVPLVTCNTLFWLEQRRPTD